MRKLIVNQVQDSDQGEYSFVADDHPTCSITAALEMTGGHITVEKKKSKLKNNILKNDLVNILKNDLKKDLKNNILKKDFKNDIWKIIFLKVTMICKLCFC